MKSTLGAAVALLPTALARSIAAQPRAPEVFAPGVISGAANELSPAFTAEGQTVFFTRSNNVQSTIVVSRRAAGRWSTPEVAPFSGEWRDLEPTTAPDGSYLVFVSNCPAVAGGQPLAAPVPVGISTSEEVGDFDPAVSPDESFMVFSARLPANGTSLFIAFREHGTWKTPTYLGDSTSTPNTWNNGLANVWYVSLDPWLHARADH